jgi:predicted SnoaL-like aldol condensation-catalyzing enzyme
MNDQLEANKRIVREWHDLAINQRKPEEAVAKYLGPHHRQHNPGAADGGEPFIRTVKWIAETYPDFRFETLNTGMSCKKFPKRQRTTTRCFSNDLLSRRPNPGRF